MKGCEAIPPSLLDPVNLGIDGDEWGEDQIGYRLGFSPQKQSAKGIKLSEYLQHVKAEKILVFNLKQYRVVEKVVTCQVSPESFS